MDEREKIFGLFNELKGLLANYPDNRVDFEFDKNDMCCFDGEEWKKFDFSIYYGSFLDYEDEFLVKSICVEDDELLFECEHTYNWEEILYIRPNKLYNITQDTEFLIDALEFFIDILKK